MPTFWDRLLGRTDTKDLELPIVAAWESTAVQWPALGFDRLKTEGYNVNAAVGACVAVHAFAYPEPLPVAHDAKGDPVKSTHPLQQLMDRPNPIMSHGELAEYVATYKCIGGNVYLHKVRNAQTTVIQLWPYHDGHFTPIPSRGKWIEWYEYDIGDGGKVRVPAADIVHLKWPLVDLDRPWMGLSPLRQIAREVDSDTEMTRMLYAFLAHDATPRTLITFPEGTQLTIEQKEAMRQQFQLRHGGDNRGGVGFLTGGATVSRLSLTMRELDLTSIRSVPEARICAGFRVPPEVAGLSVGMAHSTENNLAAADVRFTQRTLVPLWKRDAGEYTHDLAHEFGDYTITYDTKDVAALQEDTTVLYDRTLRAYDLGVVTKNEAREFIGLPPVKDLNMDDPDGDTFKGTTAAVAPQPTIIDVTPMPAQLTDDEKLLVRAAAFKAIKRTSTETLEAQMTRQIASILKAQYEEAIP